MRANGGLGTTHAWESCVAPVVRTLRGSAPFWQRHVGTDNLFVLWLFFALMTLSCVPLVPLWLMDPSDEQQLCGASMSCAAGLVLSLPFALGTGLMLRAAYPENAAQPSLLAGALTACRGLLTARPCAAMYKVEYSRRLM